MSLPIYRHRLTVTDTDITPRGPLSCGTAGDESAAELCFAGLETAYRYRLEVVTGDGGYDITEPLTKTGSEARFLIPAAWTAAGCAALRLIQLAVTNGEETARRYYPPVLLQFAYRDEGTPTDAPLQWQALLTRTEAELAATQTAAGQAQQAMTAAERSVTQAEVAATAAAASAEAAERAYSIAMSAADTAARSGDLAVGAESAATASAERAARSAEAATLAQESAEAVEEQFGELEALVGEIDTALDGIAAIQERLLGGDSA